MSNIKDKELLTFSNATNLDWQFANYIKEVQETRDNDGNLVFKTTYHTLNTLLTPESFARKDSENSDEVDYIYCDTKLSKNEKLTPEQIEKGIIKMQNTSGVLMNYLEECGKNSSEGDFLKNWEVVGGYDNYNVAQEYLNMNLDISTKILEALQGADFTKDKVIELYKRSIHQQMLDIMGNFHKREDFKDFKVNEDMVEIDTEEMTKFFNFYKQEIEPVLKKNHETCIENIKKMKASFPTRDKVKEAENRKRNLTLIYDIATHSLNVLLRTGTLKSLKSQAVIKGAIDNNNIIMNNSKMEKGIIRSNYIFNKEQLKENLLKQNIGENSKFYQKKLKELQERNQVKHNVQDKIKADAEALVEELATKLDSAFAKFIELLICDTLGYIDIPKMIKGDGKSKFKNDILSPILTMTIALFTRTNGIDYLNTGLAVGYEATMKHLNKTLYFKPEGLENSVIAIEEEISLYDTGFRATVFKKGDDIVIAYKGEGKENNEILPGGLDRIKIVYEKVRKDFPNANITLTGYNDGAELAFLHGTMYCSNEEKFSNGTFFEGNLENIRGCLNFTEHDIDKTFRSSLEVFVDAGSGFLKQQAKNGMYYIAGQMLLRTITTLAKEGHIESAKKILTNYNNTFLRTRGMDLIYVSNRISASSFAMIIGRTINWIWSSGAVLYSIGAKLTAPIAVIMGALTLVKLLIIGAALAGFFAILKALDEKKKYEFLMSKFNWLREKGIIKDEKEILGYVDAEKLLKLSQSYELKIGNETIKVELAFGMFCELELKPQRMSKVGEDYYVYGKSTIGGNYSVRTREDDYRLIRIGDTYVLEGKYNELGKQTKDTEKTRKEISSYENILSVMDITAQIQEGYNKLKEKLNFIYVNGSKVEKCNNIPTTEIIPYERENGDAVLNEHVFLPFIGTGGDIQDEIREEYVRNAFKDAVRIVVGTDGVSYSFKNKSIDDSILEIFQSKRNQKGVFGVSIVKPIYFYNLVKEKALENDLYKTFYKIKQRGIQDENFWKEWFSTDKYSTAIFCFDTRTDSIAYGYNENALLSRENYEFTGKDLKINEHGLINGSYCAIQDGVAIKNQSNKENLYKIDGKDINEEYKTYKINDGSGKEYKEGKKIDGYGEIILKVKKGETEEKIKIGENIERYFKLIKNEDEQIEESQEEWHNYGDLEAYIEKIDLEEEKKLIVQYAFNLKNKTLVIRYGTDSLLANSFVINDFNNRDFGIDLPRYHKLIGTNENENIYDRVVKIENTTELTQYEKKDDKDVYGGKKIIINGVEIGEGIKFEKEIDNFREEKICIYIDGFGNKYKYYTRNSILYIEFDHNYKVPRYGKSILIKEFVNGDYGIVLPIETPLFWGSLNREKDSDDSVRHVISKEMRKDAFKNTNGAGRIKIGGFGAVIGQNPKKINGNEDELLEKLNGRYKEFDIQCDDFYKDISGNIVIQKISEYRGNRLVIIPKEEDGKKNIIDIIVIDDFQEGDYGINITTPNILCGSEVKEYTVKQGETLSGIAMEKYKNANKWRNMIFNKKTGKTFGEEEARRIKAGDKIYIKESIKLDFKEEYQIDK